MRKALQYVNQDAAYAVERDQQGPNRLRQVCVCVFVYARVCRCGWKNG
jgi:hypothetical protein